MQPTLNQKLNSIRALIDVDVRGVDIDSVIEKGKALAQMMGLSAECKAQARKDLDNRMLIALAEIQSKKYSPSVMLRVASAMCADEQAAFEYADRLNAGITHQLDFYRSVISLHKSELENSLKQ